MVNKVMGNQYKFKTFFKWCEENNRLDLIREWVESSNGGTPNDISYGSDTVIIWKCEKCGNVWTAKAGTRTSAGQGCPKCSKAKRIESYQKNKAKNNSLSLARPDLLREWHPTKNGNLKPEDRSAKSSEEVWWICSHCGNEWKAKIISRVYGTGCPECVRGKQTSFPEQAIYYYLRKAFEGVYSRLKVGKYEFDIYIPSIKTAIEYDGVYWHSKTRQVKKEREKDEYCKKEKIRLIRIRDSSLPDTVYAECIPCKDGNNKSLSAAIKKLFDVLEKKRILIWLKTKFQLQSSIKGLEKKRACFFVFRNWQRNGIQQKTEC